MNEIPNVLIVEDESIVAIEIESRLKKMNYHVVGRLATGEEAIQMTDTLHPDLILMDIHLQGQMDGIEAAGIIKQTHDVPIIYLTAYADKETLDRAKNTGPSGYILKPFEGRELKVTIETAMFKHQMEHEIRLQQKRFQTVYHASPIGIVLANEAGNCFDSNLAAKRILGCVENPEILKQVNIFEILSLSQKDRILLDKGQSVHFQIAIDSDKLSISKSSDSPQKHLDVFMSLLNDDQNFSEEKYLIHIQDVTEIIIAEKAVEESKNLFQTLIESLPQSVVCKDLEGRFIFANQVFCKMVDMTMEELLGKTDADLSPADLAAKYYEDDQKVIQTRQFLETVEQHQVTNLKPSYIQTIKTPIIDGDDQVIGVMVIFWDVTERRKVEEQLAQEKELLHALMDNMPDTIYFKDSNSKFTRINASQARLLGIQSAEDAIGKSDVDFFTKEHAQWAYEDEQKIIKTGEPLVDKMERIRRANGEYQWVTSTKVPIKDSEGKVKGIVGITRNITEIKLAQEALAYEKDLLHTLMENIPDMIFYKDKDGLFTRINSSLARAFAIESPNDALGKTDYDFFMKSYAEQSFQSEQKIIETGKPLIGDTSQTKWPDGMTRWVSMTKVPIRDGQGRVIGLVGVGRDISDMKGVEERLRESEERYKILYDEAPIGYHEVDTDGIIQQVNRTEAEMLGYLADDMVGSCMIDYILPSQKTESKDVFDQKIKKQLPLKPFELTYLRSDGKPLEALIEERLVQDTNGHVVGMRSVLQDISERKIAEKKLQKLTEELKKSNSELEQFAYIASHDLQEPLRMVASYVQLLERRYKDKLDEDALEFISYAVDGAHRMQGLIHDLLLYSRVGTKGKDFEDVDTNEILSRVIRDLQIMVQEKEATIESDSLPGIKADGRQIGQLFQNLIANAMKFCKDKKPVIQIKAVEKGSQVIFSVKDNGIGIDPEFHERIFMIFQRLHKRDEYEGTGIGLAVCKKIVERHGGRIWIESEAGQGATFNFSINK